MSAGNFTGLRYQDIALLAGVLVTTRLELFNIHHHPFHVLLASVYACYESVLRRRQECKPIDYSHRSH